MARIRSLKPEAFTSETLAGCSIAARWTFAGLWTYVDDEGRGRANAGLVKAAVWPLDEDVSTKQVAQLLDELEAARVICRYEADGKSCLHVVNFAEHQHPNRPLPSKLPECSRRTHGGLSEPAQPPHSGPSGGTGKRPEAESAPELSRSERAHDETAGQEMLTDDSVSTHGERTTKSPSTPPTPLRNEQGEGVGEGVGEEVPPSAGAAKPRRAKASPAEAHIGTVVAAYVDGATEAGQPAPASSLKARVGKQARQLLAEGYAIDALVTAAGHMGAGEWNDLAVQVRKDAAAANGGPPGRGHQPYRNPADQSVYDEELAP